MFFFLKKYYCTWFQYTQRHESTQLINSLQRYIRKRISIWSLLNTEKEFSSPCSYKITVLKQTFFFKITEIAKRKLRASILLGFDPARVPKEEENKCFQMKCQCILVRYQRKCNVAQCANLAICFHMVDHHRQPYLVILFLCCLESLNKINK